MPEIADPQPHRIAATFNFRVQLRRSGGRPGPAQSAGARAANAPQPGDMLGDGGFQECSGLEIEMDVKEHLEGGRNNGVVRLVGRGKYSNIVLKRGMFFGQSGKVATEFWAWLQSTLSGTGPVARYDGTVEVLDRAGLKVVATWTFSRGLPVKVRGPELNARTGEVAIEELHIAHEGLRLELR